MDSTKEKMNYIFYVSDMDMLPTKGHLRKMDAERDIAGHISRGLGNTKIMCFTEYDGEVIDADSIGIVFPVHMWGSSLAVYAFLQQLQVTSRPHIYAVAVGESLSEAVSQTFYNRMKPLRQFISIFTHRGFGTENDIYVRSIDRRRDLRTTEEYLGEKPSEGKALECILAGLLFHSVVDLERELEETNGTTVEEIYDIRKNRAFDRTSSREHRETQLEIFRKEQAVRAGKKSMGYYMKKEKTNRTTPSLGNVFLDDEMFAGVKLCQVI